jgi:iron complex outermembrane receptor protein
MFAFVLGVPVMSVHAQQAGTTSTANSEALEEVTVTARKVEENIMTVPLSITALSAKDIESRDLKDMQDVSLFQPSFHFVNQAGGASGFADRSEFLVTFRGLNAGTTGVFTTGSGSVFIDGAPVVDAQIPDLSEVQRVEVLKGPQSAYFGRSTFAGAINYVTKDPTLTTFGGTASAEASSFNSSDASLSLDIPIISDMLGARISGRHLVKGGEYTNAADTSQKFGDQETDTVAATVLFVPFDKLHVKGYLNWFTNNDGPPADTAINTEDTYAGTTTSIFNSHTGPTALYQGGYFKGPIPNANKLPAANISGDFTLTPFLQSVLVQNSQGYPLPFNPDFLNHAGLRRDALQGDIRIDFEFLPGYNLSSLTAYHYDKSESIIDLDFRDYHNVVNPYNVDFHLPNTLPYEAFNQDVQRLTWDYSQEFRITSPRDRRLKWSAGVNYVHDYSPGIGLYGQWDVGYDDLANITPETADTPAIFGSISYEIVDKLTLTAEAREQWDKIKTYTTIVGGPNGGTPASALPPGPYGPPDQVLEQTYKSFSPRITLDYAYAPDSDAYLLFSRGYRPGGFNSAYLTAPVGPQAALGGATTLQYLIAQGANTSLTYKQDQLDNYELGLKSTFLDGRARTTAAIYYDRWIDAQVSTLYTVPGQNQYSPVNNSGLVELYGLEFEGDWQALDHLLLQVTAAYNGTRVVSFSPCSDCLHFGGLTAGVGDHVPNVPLVTYTLSGEYSDRLNADYNWYGRADYAFQGLQYIDYTNVAWTQPQEILNVHLGIRNEKLTLDAFVRNLLDNSAPNSTTSQVDPISFLRGTLPVALGGIPIPPPDVRYALPDKRSFGIRATYKF